MGLWLLFGSFSRWKRVYFKVVTLGKETEFCLMPI